MELNFLLADANLASQISTYIKISRSGAAKRWFKMVKRTAILISVRCVFAGLFIANVRDLILKDFFDRVWEFF
jgi:hypothetical protein